MEETMLALDGIVRSGKALYVGISNYNRLFTIPTLSSICAGREAPISTLVTSPSRKIQDKAICARDSPLAAAKSCNA